MSTMSIGAMNQMADALEKAGFVSEDFTKLKQFKNLEGVKAALNGQAKIFLSSCVDCDAEPFVPYGFSVVEHEKTGLILNLEKVKMCLYQGAPGEDSKLDLNANVLDSLLEHPELIPEEWKGGYIWFRGTKYWANGGRCVRGLYWDGNQWIWQYEVISLALYRVARISL